MISSENKVFEEQFKIFFVFCEKIMFRFWGMLFFYFKLLHQLRKFWRHDEH